LSVLVDNTPLVFPPVREKPKSPIKKVKKTSKSPESHKPSQKKDNSDDDVIPASVLCDDDDLVTPSVIEETQYSQKEATWSGTSLIGCF
jgi:hypothetical protein